MNKFLIIDGNSLIYRAYYALPFLTNSKGQNTGGVFGFLNMFLKVLEEYQPTHVAVAFDFARKTFRNKIFTEYKGTRKETPLELRVQFGFLKEILQSMGVCYIEKQCIEADDIIGTLAKSTDCETVILSGDKDVLQLVDKTTNVWLTQKGISEIYKVNEEILLKDFRLLPFQIVELKALMGDNSDNIPGVKGIGPKTATNLVEQFENIENLFNNLDNPNISKGTKQKLIEQKDFAFMSKILATIKTDCDIDVSFEKYKLTLPFPNQSIDFIKKYDLNSLLKKSKFFDTNVVIEKIEITNLKQKNIESYEELKNICQKSGKVFAFSLENDMIFSFNEDYFYTIRNELSLFSTSLDFDKCLEILKPIFENEKIEKIVSDLKLHKHILREYDIEFKGNVFDLKLASYLIGGNNFNSTDVQRFFALKQEFLSLIDKNNLITLYNEIEIPLVEVLFKMENNGFKIDSTELTNLSKKYELELYDLTQKIYVLAGQEFNINSPKQLGEILFSKLNLPIKENKKLSTNIDVLLNLTEEHDIINHLIRYRKIQKLKSTYIDSFLEIVSKKGEIIHTIFNQMLTSTGRLSSSEPNLQNIPVRDDEGRELRKLFVSRFENGMIVSADYNQIELRLLAHFSGDEVLINAFNNNKDIHTLTASQIFETPENQISKAQRRDAKAVNFGIIYGISDFGLSQNVGISRKSAKEYIEKYFASYPKVKQFMDSNVKFAKENGYINTIFNRIRRIPEINSAVFFKRQFGERVAMNMPLQGSASDIIKLAMIKVNNQFEKLNLKSKLVLQIHDELIVDAFPNEVETIKDILKNSMENVVTLKVPLPVEVESGKNWFEV
ncbi:MAG: DNA polymerase I [Clostridia bacterium]|nr:DNA polymerase I [Clostridia bacterium]